jgi:hypothetical protein
VSPAPWWTAADDAELAVLVRDLVELAFLHRERCDECRSEGRSCAVVREAIEVVLEWRERRSARSFAVALRARQDVLDARTATS